MMTLAAGWNNRLELEKNGFREISQRRQWHPTPVLLPGKFHGWRSLAGYSPQGHQESDVTKVTQHAHTYTGYRQITLHITVQCGHENELSTAAHSIMGELYKHNIKEKQDIKEYMWCDSIH